MPTSPKYEYRISRQLAARNDVQLTLWDSIYTTEWVLSKIKLLNVVIMFSQDSWVLISPIFLLGLFISSIVEKRKFYVSSVRYIKRGIMQNTMQETRMVILEVGNRPRVAIQLSGREQSFLVHWTYHYAYTACSQCKENRFAYKVTNSSCLPRTSC